MTEPVTFLAQVARVQTLADGGLRVTLDLPESAIEQAACLMAFKRWGVVGEVTYKPETVTDCNDATEKESEGGSSEVDSRRIAIRRN